MLFHTDAFFDGDNQMASVIEACVFNTAFVKPNIDYEGIIKESDREKVQEFITSPGNYDFRKFAEAYEELEFGQNPNWVWITDTLMNICDKLEFLDQSPSKDVRFWMLVQNYEYEVFNSEGEFIQLPQPDGELIVPYWILNEELDQVGKAQISLFNNNLEIDSIFIEPYYQRRGIATSFVNHVVNYWDSELLRFSDAVSDEGVAFIDSFAAEDNYDSTYGVKQAKIRRRLKKKIKKQAIMGTKAGQWSARKSQELKRQYEAACQRAGLKPYKGQKTKKQQDLDMPDDVRNELILELGDVLWYVANLAYELNATLEEVAVGNIQKLESRKVRGVLSGSGDNR